MRTKKEIREELKGLEAIFDVKDISVMAGDYPHCYGWYKALRWILEEE